MKVKNYINMWCISLSSLSPFHQALLGTLIFLLPYSSELESEDAVKNLKKMQGVPASGSRPGVQNVTELSCQSIVWGRREKKI